MTTVGTNMAITANSTNTISSAFQDMRKYTDVGLELRSLSAGTDTGALYVTLKSSMDGTNTPAGILTTISLSNVANTNAYCVTNLNLATISYFRLHQVVNESTNACTVRLTRFTKPSRYGTHSN
jgi:hypothetical protein